MTSAFGLQKWQLLGDVYPHINRQKEYTGQQNFYVYDGDSYAYDFTAHVASLGLEPDEVYGVIKQSELADGRLEYEGVADLISWIRQRGEVKILTYGTDDYQRLKVSLCPSLHDIEVITTLESKSEYLTDKGEVWLVDDKPLGNELSPNVRFIQALVDEMIYREQDEASWPVIYTLGEVIEILQKSQ